MLCRLVGAGLESRVSLPVGYVEGQKVPAIFWTYPREYNDEESYGNAAIRSRNHNAFTHMSWLRWSDLWLTETERDIVEHHKKSGKWLTPMELNELRSKQD